MADSGSGICMADLCGGIVWRILAVKFYMADLYGGFVWRICRRLYPLTLDPKRP